MWTASTVPTFLCRRCDGNDRNGPVPSSLADTVIPDNGERIKITDEVIFSTIAAAEEVHDPLDGLVEKTAENTASAMQQHTADSFAFRAHGSR